VREAKARQERQDEAETPAGFERVKGQRETPRLPGAAPKE
jgi:hypothetical protein